MLKIYINPITKERRWLQKNDPIPEYTKKILISVAQTATHVTPGGYRINRYHYVEEPKKKAKK
jgi:hypothetical protein